MNFIYFSESEHITPASERKFIVFESKLLDLFSSCHRCASPALACIKQIVGSMLKIEQNCGVCGHQKIWTSQPTTGAIPAGNLLMSAAILFSGMCI